MGRLVVMATAGACVMDNMVRDKRGWNEVHE